MVVEKYRYLIMELETRDFEEKIKFLKSIIETEKRIKEKDEIKFLEGLKEYLFGTKLGCPKVLLKRLQALKGDKNET